MKYTTLIMLGERI